MIVSRNIWSINVLKVLSKNVKTIYEAPISFNKEKLDQQVLDYFKLKSKKKVNLNPWKKITKVVLNPKKHVNIAIIGKYVNLKDAYKSLDEALVHGGISNSASVDIHWINSEELDTNKILKELQKVDGILIPGGFGYRGIEGKINAIKYARENKIPFFGICLGMQLAVIEIARNVLKLEKANSTEFIDTDDPVVGLMTEWHSQDKLEKRNINSDKGGTMRLGAYEASCK